MEWFSLRSGYVRSKAIKTGKIDDETQNRLWNCLYGILTNSSGSYTDYYPAVNYILDQLGQLTLTMPAHVKNGIEVICGEWFEKWFKSFDIIEMFLYFATENECECPCKVEDYRESFNKVLEEVKSGYRFIVWQAVPITNPAELELLTQAISSEFDTVNMHFQKAISLYSDRESPDYENTIKEAISAVEAMCCIITNSEGGGATLGSTLKKLRNCGIEIHPALESAFSKLYGYTSDANGIRHGGIDFTNAPEEDAKYMLLSCSAFVNYLIVKYGKCTD